MGSFDKSVLALILVLSAIPASARIYCCNDEHGRRVCGDILPAQCQTRAYNELNAQGVVKQKFDGPMTPEQRAQREAELERKKADEHAAAEQVRRDKAMLASYSSVADLDAKRERTVIAAQAEIKSAQERLEASQVRLAKFRKEAERYGDGKKPMPEVVRANLRDSEADVVARQKEVDGKTKELFQIQEHFDQDRRRYIELTGRKNGAEPAPPAPSPTPAR